MLSPAIRSKLDDPVYCDRYLFACGLIRKIGNVPWYDSWFLMQFEAARHYLESVKPDALDRFLADFALLRPADDFEPQLLSELFSEEVHEQILSCVRNIEPSQYTANEEGAFGRHVVHDHPFFIELQEGLREQVSALAGRELCVGYNFLSLYGADGRCAPHMDEPVSMYTLDYCIEQSEEWPIFFSPIVDWPDAQVMRGWTEQSLYEDKDISFAPYRMKANDALLFCGSSQWHYREAIAEGNFCNLLFFHFFPKGAELLVDPTQWARHFGMAELEPLCDIFAEMCARQIRSFSKTPGQ